MPKKMLIFVSLAVILTAIAAFFLQRNAPELIMPEVADVQLPESPDTGSPRAVFSPFEETFLDPFRTIFSPSFGFFVKDPDSEDTSQNNIPPAQQKIPPTLTEEEIFKRVWPDSYISYLRTIEKLMRDDEFLMPEDTITLSSDQDIYDFLQKTADYAENNGWIAAKDASQLRVGFKTALPSLITKEKDALRRGETPQGLLPKNQNISNSYDVIIDLLDGLKYILALAEPAYAKWVRGPECYKDDNPYYMVPGFSAATFCCNCGLDCDPDGCEFVPDCKEDSKDCNVPLGCLNAVCMSWPNAIWDSLTGICGCG